MSAPARVGGHRVERSVVGSSDVSVAVADHVSTSGADWANRDNDTLHRRAERDSAPYRRPPAVNSFRNDADEEEMADSQSWSAFGSPSTGSSSGADKPAADPPEPRYGPAPPAGPGRASYGFTAGPISGNQNSASPDAANVNTAGRRGRSAPTSGAPMRTSGVPAPRQPASDVPVPRQPASDVPVPRQPAEPARYPDRPVTAESVLAQARRSRPMPPPPAGEDDGVGDFIGGPGREIRPHRAARQSHQAAEHGLLVEQPRRSRGVLFAGLAL